MRNLIENILSNENQEFLENSLFYYCCGKDITPIYIYGGDIKFYVYVDLYKYEKNFEKIKNEFYKRLKDNKFNFIEKSDFTNEINKLYKLKSSNLRLRNYYPQEIENAEISKWSKNNKDFIILYIKAGAEQGFTAVYGSDKKIIPRYICNMREEMDNSWFSDIENKSEYILGYSFSKNHKKIDELDYLGDYGEQKIKIHKKICDDEN